MTDKPKKRMGRPQTQPDGTMGRSLVVRINAAQTARLREVMTRIGQDTESETVRRLIDAAALCPAEALAEFLAAGARGSVKPD